MNTNIGKRAIGSKLSKLARVLMSEEPILNKKNLNYFLLLIQALFGILWIEGSWWKITANGKFLWNSEGLAYWVGQGSKYPVFGPYKWLIDNLILPNIKTFVIGIFVAELLTGILFLTGKYVRIASILAFCQSVVIALSVLKAPHEWKWSYFMMMMLSLMFFVKPTKSTWLTKSK
jgi:thiosulfate dehydrogenase (quinone) large subunit